MSKKTKLKPVILHTREGMEAEATEYVKLQLRLIELTARMEQRKAEVEQEFEKELNEVAQQIEIKFAAVQNFCETHRSLVVTAECKSFDTVNATIGFRDTPPAVDKKTSDTWEGVARRMEGLVFYHPEDASKPPEQRRVVLDCSQYVKAPPQLLKAALLADRSNFTAEQLRAMGIKFTSEELFYITPKSQVAAGDVKEAA